MAGAPQGNTNSNRNNRLWADTIKRACIQGDGDQLRKIAEKLIEKAIEGDIQAIKELGDRIDGKAMQAVEAIVEANMTISERPPLTKEEWLLAHGVKNG